MSLVTAELKVGDQVAAAYRNPVSPDYELTVELGDGVFEAVALKTIDAHIQQASINTLHTDDSIQWVVFNRDETIFDDPLGELPQNAFVEDSVEGVTGDVDGNE